MPEVDVAVVCRGGGSLTDLWAFCDETLCRTVALLRLPVISAVGHESDRTLIDDVSAVCCSTPTHAANALVQVDVNTAGRISARSRRSPRGRPRPRSDLGDRGWRSWRAARNGASDSSADGCTSFYARSARRRRAGRLSDPRSRLVTPWW